MFIIYHGEGRWREVKASEGKVKGDELLWIKIRKRCDFCIVKIYAPARLEQSNFSYNELVIAV